MEPASRHCGGRRLVTDNNKDFDDPVNHPRKTNQRTMKLALTHTPYGTTDEKYVEFDESKIEQIYYGKGNCCRCGCGGYYAQPDSDIQTDKDIMRKALKLFRSGKREIESIDGFVFEIKLSGDKVYCLYTDEPQKTLH